MRLVKATGCWLAAWCAIGGAPGGRAAEPGSAPTPDCPTAERVVLTNGQTLYGLIESKDDAWVHLIQIQRQPGKMHLVIRPIERGRVASVHGLDETQRAALREQIERFRNRAAIEAAHMEAVRLRAAGDGAPARWRYRGKWFDLESSLDEPTTRRVVVRVEQMCTAYRQVLAPRCEPPRAPTVAVYGAMQDYRSHLARLGLAVQNPACYLPDDNLVLAGSELNRVAAALAQLRSQHAQLQKTLREMEKEIEVRLGEQARRMKREGIAAEQIAKTLARQRQEADKQLAAKRLEIQRVDRQNEQQFQQVAGRMFSQLYHEAFHAYLENHVYPRDRFRVPLWLNEGLAQVFESPSPEPELLRIDAPNAEMLKRLKKDLAGPAPLLLAELLAADQAAFLDAERGGRLYLYAWGLAYYLCFERGLLGSPTLDAYVSADARPGPAVERFERLVGAPLGEFEPQWRQFVAGLK